MAIRSFLVLLATCWFSHQALLGQERRRPPLIEALDLNRDGILSATEITKAPASLKKMDRDGDGQIDRQELRTASRRTNQQPAEAEPLKEWPEKLTAGIHRISIEHDGEKREMAQKVQPLKGLRPVFRV